LKAHRLCASLNSRLESNKEREKKSDEVWAEKERVCVCDKQDLSESESARARKRESDRE